MDGFITRRPQRSSLNDRTWQKTGTTVGHMRKDKRSHVEMHTGDKKDVIKLESPRESKETTDIRQNISQSLEAIDSDTNKNKKKAKQQKKKRKFAKIISLIIGLLLFVGIGFLVFKAWQFGNRIFQGNILGIFQQQELKKDKHGRSNVLILGSTDDMDRDGASLTDSMMVLSVDQKKKDAYMFSVPRDLYVQYGRACAPGYAGKINALYICGDEGEGEEAEKNRMDVTRQVIGKIFDMDIQYVVHINTVVIRDSVNTLGGITVNVKGSDPRGVLDSIFDDMCKNAPGKCPNGHYMMFKNGPNEMDGDQAMAFSQARGMGNLSYGLEGSNFAREKNQQLVLTALKEKAASSGTLTDFSKVLGLMDTFGDNLRTNIDPKEVRTIMSLASEIKNEDIHRLSFVEEDNPLMTTGNVGGQSIVQPTAGLYNYGPIQAYLRKTIFATPVTKENSKVIVLNGGSIPGRAQREADKIEGFGVNVVFVGNAPEGSYGKYKVYQLADKEKKAHTRAKLEEVYQTKINYNHPQFGLSTEADFVIVIGEQAE